MQSDETADIPDLTDLSPQARELLRVAMPEAQRALNPDQLQIWVDGARQLIQTDVGLAALVTYVRAIPQLAKQAGTAVMTHAIATVVSIATHADGTAADAFLSALSTASRRLITAGSLLGFFEVVDEITALAPRALVPMFDRIGPLLDQLSVDGLRRWALLGVQEHVSDFGSQDAWFKLESTDARAVLRAAGEGTLFTQVERRLGLYLRALWGVSRDLRSGSVAAPPNSGGAKGRRVAIVNGAICMPQSFDVFPGQPGLTLYRAAAAHAAAHLAWSTARFPVRELKAVQMVLVSLIEDARVEKLAMREMPGLKKLWAPFHVALPTFSVSAVSLMARLSRALFDDDYRDANPWVTKGRTMFAEHSGDLENPGWSRTIGMLLGNDLGQMRVQFNFKTYVIEPLYRDDNMFLWDFGDAGQSQPDDQEVTYQAANLQPDDKGDQSEIEIEQNASEQSMDPPTEVQAGALKEVTGDDAMFAQTYRYDEWDYAINLERPDWCTVIEKAGRLGDPRSIDEILSRNRDTVDRLTTLIKAAQIQRPIRLRKQLEGDKLDLDACISATIDLRSGRTPDPRIHARHARQSRDLAVLLLLDLSQSTNDYVPSAGTTVLNLAREATALVADAMSKIGDSFAIHGFDSNGRHEVEYYRFKDFDEPYSEQSRARLAGMTGQLSTRMGTALRHAGRFLHDRRVARKLILLVTDGEPHDIDVHDRKYLVFDAKHAVEEQTRHGIATFCISLDSAADEYVTRIFGVRNYLVLDHLRRLPEKLPMLYMRLTS
ncbi:MAG: VWA domain-containing protein [Betaproteobacteria bacterium]